MDFDLHMHSHYSDGSFSPEEVVQKCRERGLKVISLTDHENVGGISQAEEAGERLGIKIIPGIEFAADFEGQEHHILGYFINSQNSALAEFLETWKKTKAAQVKKIIEKLHTLGFTMSFEEVMAVTKGSLDRYHIAVVVYPDADKSPAEAEKRQAFFKKFLLEKSAGGEGLAFEARRKPDIQSVIDTIHHSGGLAFWAHPFWKMKEESVIGELASTFRKIGLDGIEALYSFHAQEQSLFLHKIARDLSMYESGGSDFHREAGSSRQLSQFQTFGIEINFPFER